MICSNNVLAIDLAVELSITSVLLLLPLLGQYNDELDFSRTSFYLLNRNLHLVYTLLA